MATQGPEVDKRSSSASEMSNVQIDEEVNVPDVEVKHSPFQSQPSLRSGVLTDEEVLELGDKMRKEQAKKYFSLREGAFTNAVEECKTFLDTDDGELLSTWLLSEIDHWDHEKERIVLITKKSLCLVKYNFIGLKVDEIRKIPLIRCDKIQIGRFVYPKTTMMMITGYAENSPRNKQSGMRIFFSSVEPSFFQMWNPWSDMPYFTLTSHVQSMLQDSPPDRSQHDPFSKALIKAITEAREADPHQERLGSFEVVEGDLQINIYLGLSAMVYNQSSLGFCKDRGSVFF
ncbi:tumor protein p63-regulated gene 1-like protein isoform X1 [Stylophora pistillata]|uniref:Tumor protein p63-regulated gene 1-like protein n=1 Tax=Stylophora pistillata TaxID=50429 RepID=A0A2B4SUS3_STYPI|nr:tumor protein p63-regulated gene 1-like protein isoform X1 [Stylophora pistillata]PFX32843.1 Tumor protein p63-regulated gene 1-like protein [Stylophora pistillata]